MLLNTIQFSVCTAVLLLILLITGDYKMAFANNYGMVQLST